MVLLPQQALASSTLDPGFQGLLDPQTYNQLLNLVEELTRQLVRPLLQTPPEHLQQKLSGLLPAYLEYIQGVQQLALPLADLEIYFYKMAQGVTSLLEQRHLSPGALAAFKMATDTYLTFVHRLRQTQETARLDALLPKVSVDELLQEALHPAGTHVGHSFCATTGYRGDSQLLEDPATFQT